MLQMRKLRLRHRAGRQVGGAASRAMSHWLAKIQEGSQAMQDNKDRTELLRQKA